MTNWVKPEDWSKTEIQQWIINTIIDGQDYEEEEDNSIIIRIPWGLTQENVNFLVNHLNEMYPGNVLYFSPRKARFVEIHHETPAKRLVYKIRTVV